MMFDVWDFCAYKLKGAVLYLQPGLLPLLHGDFREKAMQKCQVCSHLSEVHTYSSQTRDLLYCSSVRGSRDWSQLWSHRARNPNLLLWSLAMHTQGVCGHSPWVLQLCTHNRSVKFIKGKHTPCALLSLLTQLEVPDLLREFLGKISMSGDNDGAKSAGACWWEIKLSKCSSRV